MLAYATQKHSRHCVCSCLTGIHFRGEFDLANMKSISYESQELKERLPVEDLLGAVTFKSNIQVLTLPLNKEGLFVSHLLRYEGELRPEEYLKTLFDNEDISCNVVYTNDWQGHFASAETLQQGRVFLAGNLIWRSGFGLRFGSHTHSQIQRACCDKSATKL